VSPDSDFVCIFAKEFRRVSTISLLLSCIALKIVTQILLKANVYKSAVNGCEILIEIILKTDILTNYAK
jgi:hypothetical protein